MGSSIVTTLFLIQSKLSHCALPHLPKGVQNNHANRSCMLHSCALFDNPKFLILFVIYYAHLHGC